MLSGNPWVCTCGSIGAMQDFIFAFNEYIGDYQLMICDNASLVDNNMRGVPVTQVDQKELCEVRFDPWIIVIMVEIVLLSAMIINFARDYRRYKKTGRLPWLSRHVPSWVPLPSLSSKRS